MSIKTLIFFLSVLVSSYSAQSTDTAIYYYKLGVAAFKNLNYQQADSFYTLSLEIQPHPNAYFNRGICNLKQNNLNAYCLNMAFAAGLADKEANSNFLKDCGTTDTLYTTKTNLITQKGNPCYYQVSYRSQYMNDVLIARYRQNSRFLNFSWAKEDLKTDSIFEDLLNVQSKYTSSQKDSLLKNYRSPDFPGGIMAMQRYLRQNMSYPKEAMENGISGKVYLIFVINSLGYIIEPKVTRGIKDYKVCDEEALRVIRNMPRWMPARKNNKPVISGMAFPVSFRINGG